MTLTGQKGVFNLLVYMQKSAQKQIIEIGRRLYQNGFISAYDGNLSIRLNKTKILITPSGKAKGFLSDDDPVTVDQNGNIIKGAGKPSSEILMHLFVYKHRNDINACCHAHPPYATALSAVGEGPPNNLLPESILTAGEIVLTDYAAPGTEAVGQSLAGKIADHEAFILKNHGVLTIGRNLEEAYFRMETVEHLAKIFYIAKNSGKLDFLAENEVRRLKDIRSKSLQESD